MDEDAFGAQLRADLPFLTLDPARPGATTILCLADGPGATWRISFERPLRAARARREVRFACLDEAALRVLPPGAAGAGLRTLMEVLAPDAVVMSRFAGPLVGPVLREAARAACPVVVHLDDDLFQVPDELGPAKAARHGAPARRGSLHAACRGADLIYASTRALHLRLGRAGYPAPAVYGAVYCAAHEPFADYAPRRPPAIGYMGTSGHEADLAAWVPAVLALMRARADLRFETFGTVAMPPALAEAFPGRVSRRPPVADYDAFLDAMRGLGWAVGLAPLRPTPFNAVKADTKLVEYAAAGIPAVVAEGPAYAEAVAAGAALAAGSAEACAAAAAGLLDAPGRAAAQ
ncbi:hypothetical protein, partial [Methylobacterium crusticola]